MKKSYCFIHTAGFSFAPGAVNTDRVMLIGRNALYFEDYVLAIQYFNQVISAKPYLADPYYYRGLAKFMLDDFKGRRRLHTLSLNVTPIDGSISATCRCTSEPRKIYRSSGRLLGEASNFSRRQTDAGNRASCKCK